MKAVILLAGRGRRISAAYGGMHKTLIPLNGRPLIHHLLDNVLRAGITEIVPVVGYLAETVIEAIQEYIADKITITPCYNTEYSHTNNLYSLLKAQKAVCGEDYIVINGDMVFDHRILCKMVNTTGSAIAVDNGKYPVMLDSPRVLIEDDAIRDIGRHRTIEQAQGYAVGIYRFGTDIQKVYRTCGEALTKEKEEAGYHEPLIGLLDRYTVRPCYTEGYEWMDVDEAGDVERAEKMLLRIAEANH